jgi:hypothetical protein
LIRLKISELIAKYRLQPELRDVFVEGSTDKDILSWYIRAAGLTTAKVYPIELIDVPVEILNKYGLTEGNRQRVIALSREIGHALGHDAPQATGVVDADFDRLLGRVIDCAGVLVTDYPAIEIYFAHEVPLSKYFAVVLGKQTDPNEVLQAFGTILSELFLIRVSLDLLKLSVMWIPFDKACSRKDDALVLNRDKFIMNLLQNSNALPYRQALFEKIEELRPKLGLDVRQSMHGHDFVGLLLLHTEKWAKRRGLQSTHAMSTALMACLERTHLDKEPLFIALLQRLAGHR